MAVQMVSELHQGTGASDLLLRVRWKRKSANPSTETPSLGATATNLFDGSGVNNDDFLDNQTMETSKTKKLTPNLMRTFSVLLTGRSLAQEQTLWTQLLQPTLRTMSRWTWHERRTGRERRTAPVDRLVQEHSRTGRYTESVCCTCWTRGMTRP